MNLKEKFQLKGTSLSERDSLLLMGLGIVIVLFVGFKFLIMPKFEDLKGNYKIYSSLNKQYEALKDQNDNIKKLQNEHNELKFKKERMQLQIPAFDSPAHTVLLLENESKICNLKLSNMTFDDVKIMSKEEYLGAAGAAEQKPAEEGNNEPLDVAGCKVIDSSFSLGFSGSYNEVYNFLKKLEANDRKFSIKEMSLNVGDGKLLMGNIKAQSLSYVDSDLIIAPPIPMPEIKGKFDIFARNSNIENISKDKSYYTPNLSLYLNPANYQGPKMVFSEYAKFDKEIYNNDMKPIDAKLKIEKLDKDYTITYSLGNVTKTIKKQITPRENAIKFDVLSTPRIGGQDLMGVNMTIENKTPFKIDITVVNDDLDRPKFNLVTKSEQIRVKRVKR